MRKLLMLMLCTVTIVSCTGTNGTDDVRLENDPGGGAVSIPRKVDDADLGQSGYRGQLPYVVTDSSTTLAEFNASVDLESKVADPDFTWQDFDAMYHAQLPTDQKQNLAFIILSKKDLIGLLHADRENLQYRDAVKKYVDVLTGSHYFGYCVLYSALENIDDPNYVHSKSGQILDYSVMETFHESFLNNAASESVYFRKVEEDYGYLQRIREMHED